jgi:hypothetical protein
LAYFRPQGALFEAKDIVVEGCTFIGSEAPIVYAGVDAAVVRYNTLVRPEKWVMRILQETNEPGFVACRNGRFERNLIVFSSNNVRTAVNVGSDTQPETFTFADNLWYCEDQPRASRPQLPNPEKGGVWGIDPRLAAAQRGPFRPQNRRAARFGATALPAK